VCPFEVLPCIEEEGLMWLCLYSERPIEMLVAGALVHLTACRSENWKKAMRLNPDEAVGIEISLDASDFRVVLGEEEKERIKRQITVSVEASLHVASRELWQRLKQ
jgi:hypothetical protein